MTDIPLTMQAMVLETPKQPLRLITVPTPIPGPGQVLLQVLACGVCRTDLHILDGELSQPRLPLILGHEIVGRVVALGDEVSEFSLGQRLGVPWLGSACEVCPSCCRGEENLCDAPEFTGYTRNGGYAQYTIADHRFCFPLPSAYSDIEAAPLLCAGLIGYRSYRLAGAKHVERLGLYGFGAAAHILAQIAVFYKQKVYAFTSPGDLSHQRFARQLGAVWAGDSTQPPPDELDAAIIFAPVGSLVPAALRAVRKGGVVVCGGIHMSDIPSFPYQLLWQERSLRSVANLTRADGFELFQAASEIPLQVQSSPYPLALANQALEDLRRGKITGAAVLVP